jgi:hypothetical protein
MQKSEDRWKHEEEAELLKKRSKRKVEENKT